MKLFELIKITVFFIRLPLVLFLIAVLVMDMLSVNYFNMSEYYELKGEATKRCGAIEMDLERLLQSRLTDNNALQFERGRLSGLKERVKNVRFF